MHILIISVLLAPRVLCAQWIAMSLNEHSSSHGLTTPACRYNMSIEIPCFSDLKTQSGKNWHEYFLRLEHKNARVLVVLLSKAFFQLIPCLKKMHKAVEKGLVIIPVRVEEPGKRDGDIARDMESMWPDTMIEKYARKEWQIEVLYTENLNTIRLKKYAVKEALGNLNTFPPRGSLFGCDTGLKDLFSRVEGIAYPPPS
jgi:hypothetical protein